MAAAGGTAAKGIFGGACAGTVVTEDDPLRCGPDPEPYEASVCFERTFN